MTWSYRVIRKQIRVGEAFEDYYAVHEVFYDKENMPDSVTMDPISVGGDTLEEVKITYLQMAEAFEQPVLEWESFQEPGEIPPGGYDYIKALP